MTTRQRQALIRQIEAWLKTQSTDSTAEEIADYIEAAMKASVQASAEAPTEQQAA